MEKKTKKLQLRKETIAVLNGEHMTHVVGGGSGPTDCPPTMEFGFIENPNGPGNYGCYCKDGHGFNPEVQQCVPLTIVITTIIIITTIPKPAY